MNVRVRDLDIPTIETIDGLNNKRIELSKNPVATCGMDLHVGDCLYSRRNNVIYTVSVVSYIYHWSHFSPTNQFV